MPDLLLLNVRLSGSRGPDAMAVHGGRVQAVGSEPDLRHLARPGVEVADGRGGLALPGFHDAHMHLLSYARSLSSVDCRRATCIADIRRELACQARRLPPGQWLRAAGYDEQRLAERRHPHRRDLDAVSTQHPIRLQHRSLHLDVVNTPALRLLDLSDAPDSLVERDGSGEPTGRLYHTAAHRRRLWPRTASQVDLGLACRELLSLGVTSIQDASADNGPDQWRMFLRLASCGLPIPRLFVMPGYTAFRRLLALPECSPLVRRVQVKLMVNEMDLRPSDLRLAVAEVHRAGGAAAIHAATEAELAVALDALETAGPPTGPLADRIEHACVIPDAFLPRLRRARVTVTGSPAWLHTRAAAYAQTHDPAIHGWLHRARSLVEAGIPYAAGSDAPVADPNPLLAFASLRRRELCPAERLDAAQALAAVTSWPAAAVGAGDLGVLRPGAPADVVVLGAPPDRWQPGDASPVLLTMVDGRIAWRR